MGRRLSPGIAMVKAGAFIRSIRGVLRASPACRAYPPRNLNDFFVSEDFRNTVEADVDSTFRRIDRQMRSVEDAMLRLERDGGANSRQYSREWRTEGSSGREYFHESVVISRPSSTAAHQHRRGSPAVGYLGVVMATVAAVMYVRKAREFRDVAEDSVYRGEHLSGLSVVAPVLALFSSRFRQEWARASARKKDRTRTNEVKEIERATDSLTDV